MQHALSLARKALGHVSPNPAVGAVIVNNGVVVGQGETQPPGSPHAEVMALVQAGTAARGGIMYVSLEPCCHFGRTPPCTEAIIAGGISEVHLALLDPNPLVRGKGKAQLEAAGIRTRVGERRRAAREINEAYLKYITRGTPFITAKFAMSLDGKIASRTLDSRWISNEQSREYLHSIRQTVDAIVVGVNTVIRDDPQLTARIGDGASQPMRVIIDSHGRTPLESKVFRSPGEAVVVTTEDILPARASQYAEVGAQVLTLPQKNGVVDLGELPKALGARHITSVLVEGGGALLGSFFDLRLVDKVVAFIAPIVVGGKDAIAPVAGQGIDSISQALRLRRVRVKRFGDDTMISGYLR